MLDVPVAAQPLAACRCESDPSQDQEGPNCPVNSQNEEKQVTEFGGESLSSNRGCPGSRPELILLSEPAPSRVYFLSPLPAGLGWPVLVPDS